MRRDTVERAHLSLLAVTLGDAGGEVRVRRGLAVGVSRRILYHLIGIGDAKRLLRREMQRQVVHLERGAGQPAVGGHV